VTPKQEGLGARVVSGTGGTERGCAGGKIAEGGYSRGGEPKGVQNIARGGS